MSISRAPPGTTPGTLSGIEPEQPASEPLRRPVAAVLAAFAVLVMFVLVQLFAASVVTLAFGTLKFEGALHAIDAVYLWLVQLVGIAVASALVVSGFATWQGIGLRAQARQVRRGFVALAPVGLIVVLPTIGYSIATGDPLVDPSLDAPRIAAFMLLALFIAINEELWFRGLIVDVLGGAQRPWLVVFGSALLFGLPHIGTSSASVLNMVGVTLAVGIPFAAVRVVHHALVPLIAWHFVIDAWAFLHTASVVAEGDPSVREMAAGIVLPLLLALAYLSWLRTARYDRFRTSAG